MRGKARRRDKGFSDIYYIPVYIQTVELSELSERLFGLSITVHQSNSVVVFNFLRSVGILLALLISNRS